MTRLDDAIAELAEYNDDPAAGGMTREVYTPTYAAALDHFVAAVEDGTALTPSLDDGLKAQAIAEAATRSLRTGRSERIEY